MRNLRIQVFRASALAHGELNAVIPCTADYCTEKQHIFRVPKMRAFARTNAAAA